MTERLARGNEDEARLVVYIYIRTDERCCIIMD